MASIPQSHADLFDKKSFANLATVNADGSPQVTPVWWDTDGTNILVNTAKGRVKTKNLERSPKVAVLIVDPVNPDRYVTIQGRVVEMTEQGADDHINALSKKYFGKDVYPYRQPGEVRVIFKIKPEKVHSMG
jgi:PPOX class probable F420-dependent enzyme